jgi:2-amino-4-hydroxy-6-hydroxymethyldihydropteridine diphosphokinase
MHVIYLSLGSNIGDRARNIDQAITRIQDAGVTIKKRSALYLTEPLELREQEWFLNCAVEAETELPAVELLHALQRIEQEAGRQRVIRSGPRTLDIDLLLFDSDILHGPELEIPHPRMADRRFVLVPLNEIAPTLLHPELHCTIADMLAETEDRSAVRSWMGLTTPGTDAIGGIPRNRQ